MVTQWLNAWYNADKRYYVPDLLSLFRPTCYLFPSATSSRLASVMALITASCVTAVYAEKSVLHGDIEDSASPADCITRPDVHALQPYETTRHSSPLHMLVVLKLQRHVTEQTCWRRGDGVLLATGASSRRYAPITAQTVNCAILSLECTRRRMAGAFARSRRQTSGNVARPGEVPAGAGVSLSGYVGAASFSGPHTASRQLMLEGIMPYCWRAKSMSARNAKTRISVTGEYHQRLELIRRLLEQTPESLHAERTATGRQ